MKLMYLAATALLLASAPFAWAGPSAVLSTPKHIAVVVVRCPEGDVNCNDVGYVGVDKNTGASITLKGSDWVRMCADKVTPCQHLGYQFHNAGTDYYVSDEGELTVTAKGNKVLLSEKGKWIER